MHASKLDEKAISGACLFVLLLLAACDDGAPDAAPGGGKDAGQKKSP